MKKENWENSILEKAKTFKSRANKGRTDEKRHDLIQSDERKIMFAAHKELGWSAAKIGKEFSRSPKSIKKALEKEQNSFKSGSEKFNKKKQPSALLQKQKEHIKMLQQMARIAVADLPPDLPDLDSATREEFDSFNESMAKVYHYLTGDPYWGDMACHLGEESKRIEKLSRILDDDIPGSFYGSTMKITKLDQYKKDLSESWILMKSGGIKIISESSETLDWEYYGLNQRCPECQGQKPDPVGIDPTDYDNYPTFPRAPWRLTKNMADKVNSMRKRKTE